MQKTSIKRLIELAKLFFVAAKQIGVEELTIFLTSMISRNANRKPSDELEKVAVYIGIPSKVINAKSRKRELVESRQVAMYLSRRNTKESLNKIGAAIGGKDHATVIHACKTVEILLETDRQFREKWLPLIMSR